MALKGIKIIEFAGLAPVPFCGKILRDLGARVIRVDKLGTKFDSDRLSHDKESIAVNLKNEKGIDIIKKLTSNADVLIEPFRKGVMERLGLGPKVICELNPKIIYARLTGYGQFGELSEKAGHDINYISYSGVLSTFGREKEKPYAPVNVVADFAGGGLMCALAIMSALYERDAKKTNTGKVIDSSMVEGAAYLSSWLWSSRDLPGLWAGSVRGTNLLDGGYYAYDTYETKDGEYMACGPLEPAFYQELLKGLNLVDASEVTKEVLEAEFKKKTQKEWIEIFKNLDACVSPVLKLNEAPNNPHNKERNSFVKLDDESYLPDMNWLKLNEANRRFQMPKIGQNTSNILHELGYSSNDIMNLINEKVVEESDSKFNIQKSKL